MPTGTSNDASKTYSEKKATKNSKFPFQPITLKEDKEQFEAVRKKKSIAVTYFLKRYVFSFLVLSTIWSIGQTNLPETKKTTFFPNVCKNSISVEYTGKSAIITVDKLNDIRPGDKIRVLDNDKNNPYDGIVSSVRGNYFTIEGLSKEKYGDKVFVYGKEVNDFRTVDYDAMSVMNYTGIKKLTKQVEDQKQVIENLQTDIVALKASMDKMIALVQEQNAQISNLKAALTTASQTTGKTETKVTTETPEVVRFVPNVYSKAISISYTNDQAVITVDKLEGLKPGDKIKLYNDKNESFETTVATVNGNCFTIEKISQEMFGKNIFVYGKEVSYVHSEGL